MLIQKMKRESYARRLTSILLALFVVTVARAQQPGPQQAQASATWKSVDRAMGRSGKLQPGDVYKYSFPRSDLRVSIGNVVITPALGLGGWVAFKRMGKEAIAMGDLVLLENEVAPVMAKLQQMGVNPTALHNHLLHESPHVMYMHIEGRGDPTQMAEAVHAALTLTKTPAAKPEGAASPQPFDLDIAKIAKTLGQSGKVNGGVYQVAVPRAEVVRMEGMAVPPSMGVATTINFQPTGGGKAAITGDFVLTASEVSPVTQALRTAGIQVTALHSHMLMEEPRLFFMHYWANSDAVKLAHGLRAALDQTKVRWPVMSIARKQ